MIKPWLAISWFSLWGLFQAYAVLAILTQRWHKPASFPAEAYQALIYPDITFIPLYLWSAPAMFRARMGLPARPDCGWSGALCHGLLIGISATHRANESHC